MPDFRDLCVRINVDKVNDDGNALRQPLQEWGLHKMKSANKVSAYVEAQTGKKFYITVKPKIPYPWKGHTTAHQHNTRSLKLKTHHRSASTGTYISSASTVRQDDDPSGSRHSSARGHRYSPSGHNEPYDSDIMGQHEDGDLTGVKEEVENELDLFSIPKVQIAKRHPEAPPYNLLASLYLDGRPTAERQVVVYLDPYDDDYGNGEFKMKTRLTQGRDGNVKELAWVFQDVGIETIFDKMGLGGGVDHGAPDLRQDEKDLVAALSSSSLTGEKDFEKQQNKPGQVVVTIQRIVTLAKWRDPDFRPSHDEGELETVDMAGADRQITHTAGFDHHKSAAPKPIRIVTYDPYIEGEGPIATFQFFYRCPDILAKFNFPGYKPQERLHMRMLKDTIALTTPLNIMGSSVTDHAFSKSHTTPKKRKIVTFGEDVQIHKGDQSTSAEKLRDAERPVKRHEPTLSSTSVSSAASPSGCTNLIDSVTLDSHLSKARSDSRGNSPSSQTTFSSASTKRGIHSSRRSSFAATSTTPISSPDGSPSKGSRLRRPPATVPASGYRIGASSASDADDERESFVANERYSSSTLSRPDKDTATGKIGETGVSEDKFDDGLSIGITKLVLGKRGRVEDGTTDKMQSQKEHEAAKEDVEVGMTERENTKRFKLA